MSGTTSWEISGGGVTIEVTAEVVNGNVVLSYKIVEGEGDLNGIFIDWKDDGGDSSQIGSKANNMNGSDENGFKLNGFDWAEELGSVGGNDEDHTEGTVSFSLDELREYLCLDADATEAQIMEALAGARIGFRLTSVGEDREDSLKLTGTGEYDPGNGGDDDFFEEWPQDISNAVFYIDTTGDGEWDLAIKIDNFPDDDEIGWISNDMDDFYACMFEYIKHKDDRVDDDSVLIGVSIKGGKVDDAFFLIEGDTNGPLPDPDDAPDPLLNTGTGTTEYQYADFYEFYLEDCVA
jgi:hypothetical protein